MKHIRGLINALINKLNNNRLINRIKLELKYRKRLKELKKRDPFIYK